jgi:Asp-tRNA(Asn)/Glu-tRNA(Gln) amidotransferase A subunit family amidase
VLRSAGEPLGAGPLAGVPIAIKDLTMTAGVRTTFGSAAFADYVPTVDSDVVVLLREAGLISLGKTTTREFGLSLYSEGEVAPPAATRGRPAARPADPAAARRRRSPVHWCRSPRAATAAAHRGSRPRSAAAGSPEQDFAAQARFSPYCAADNLTGQPAVSLPLGVCPDGAPVGIMLAARPGADGLLLTVSGQLERVTRWADRHPPVWSRPGVPIA